MERVYYAYSAALKILNSFYIPQLTYKNTREAIASRVFFCGKSSLLLYGIVRGYVERAGQAIVGAVLVAKHYHCFSV